MGLCFAAFTSIAQNKVVPDSSNKPVSKPPLKDNSVRNATLFALIPGCGQIYNKRYWKVPVVYAGFGVLTYSLIFYNGVYNDVRTAYKQSINNEPITDPEYANVPEDMLYNLRESYRKYRDLSAIGIGAWYAITIVDAAVDAHLKGFDVSDNLSIRVKPTIVPVFNQPTYAMKVQLRF